MPYYHRTCGGEIAFWALKCKKCNKKWPWWLFFSLKPITRPKDEGPARDITPFYLPEPKGKPIKVVKGGTAYASWADNIPLVGLVASRLPNWPRWARILTVIVIVLAIVTLIIFLTGGFEIGEAKKTS